LGPSEAALSFDRWSLLQLDKPNMKVQPNAPPIADAPATDPPPIVSRNRTGDGHAIATLNYLGFEGGTEEEAESFTLR